MDERLQLRYPVAVEGKYDKIKLSAVISSPIIVLDGSGVFRNSEKIKLLRLITKSTKLIILTDSDRAGHFLRNKIKGYIGSENIINVYIPQIEGREKRKNKDSADRLLGVEGMETEVLRGLLTPYCDGDSSENHMSFISKTDFYFLGLSGGKDSLKKREKLAELLGLPSGMSANALLEAVNMLYTKEQIISAMREITDND